MANTPASSKRQPATKSTGSDSGSSGRRAAPARRADSSGRAAALGNAGELHQLAAEHGDTLTTNHGAPISDNQNSLRAGERGPTLLEDFVLREKIFHFDHERIPERIVHARGSGAHGFFECTNPIPELTTASLFQKAGERVPVFARFSTVAGGAGSVDTVRDVRGFAVKFYTPTGNWDLVGNDIPVFFIQDAIKFPDLVHSVKMESDRGYPQAASAHDTFWDFISLMPEATHMLMWAMSDRGIPRSLRMIDGFGVHTFPEEVVPLTVVGTMTLDRNPDNFFAETEQVAFLPTNIVPGIDFSNDPLLQGRLFSYLDTQKSRLGTTNFHQIPINAPRCPFANIQRDGMMQTSVPTGRANYEPNSLDEAGEDAGPRETTKGIASFPETLAGDKLRVRSERFADHYSQARLFFRSQTAIEQAHLASAIVFELSKVTLDHVRTRMLANLGNVDTELAARVADGLGVATPEPSTPATEVIDMDPCPSLSILAGATATLQGRKVGILFTDGSPRTQVDRVAESVRAAGGTPLLIAPLIRSIATTPSPSDADAQLAGTPSVTCDAIAIVLNEAGAAALCEDAAAVAFVADAFAHLKAIGHTPAATRLLERANVRVDAGVTGLGKAFVSAAGRRFFEREPSVRNLA